MKRLRRRKGATLGLVAVLVLFILALGIAFFIVAKFLGGGREMANATDAGTLNVAKNAIRNPAKDALAFANPDVGTNFALLGENPRNLDLLNYNRLVAQAMIVALNAKDEGTSDAAKNAKKVWTALNDVGQYLRSNHDSASVMGGYFLTLAQANNLKMLGNNGVSLTGYETSFMHRGKSTNVTISPILLASFSTPPAIPVNSTGASSPGGDKYMSGYTPLSVALPNGETLAFSGVTVLPQDRAHLVNLQDFKDNNSDKFMTDLGLPANTLPVNAFKSAGQSKEKHTQGWAGATACAIVSSMNVDYMGQIPYGYIVIKNGPNVTPPQSLAATGSDIFSHALAKPGIVVNDQGFFSRNLRGATAGSMSDPGAGTPPDWDKKNFEEKKKTVEPLMRNLFSAYSGANMLDQWAAVNQICRWLEVPFGPVVWPIARALDIPPMGASVAIVRMPNGDVPSVGGFQSISGYTTHKCDWTCYDSAMCDPVCLQKLEDFRKGYNQYGSTAQNTQPNEGFNAVEYLKADVMNKRVMCKNCGTVQTPPPGGVKLFVHGQSYPSPKGPYNFGKQATPYDYLTMIDTVPGGDGCALNATVVTLLKRCQQMSAKVTRADLETALKSKKLLLGADLYLYMQGNKLVMENTPPPWMVAGSRTDGIVPPIGAGCGKSYPVRYTLVDTSTGQNKPGSGSTADDDPPVDTDVGTDGGFPGFAWKNAPDIKCMDQALWSPSTGYNNLLGELNFSNSCLSGGSFCQPN